MSPTRRKLLPGGRPVWYCPLLLSAWDFMHLIFAGAVEYLGWYTLDLGAMFSSASAFSSVFYGINFLLPYAWIFAYYYALDTIQQSTLDGTHRCYIETEKRVELTSFAVHLEVTVVHVLYAMPFIYLLLYANPMIALFLNWPTDVTAHTFGRLVGPAPHTGASATNKTFTKRARDIINKIENDLDREGGPGINPGFEGSFYSRPQSLLHKLVRLPALLDVAGAGVVKCTRHSYKNKQKQDYISPILAATAVAQAVAMHMGGDGDGMVLFGIFAVAVGCMRYLYTHSYGVVILCIHVGIWIGVLALLDKVGLVRTTTGNAPSDVIPYVHAGAVYASAKQTAASLTGDDQLHDEAAAHVLGEFALTCGAGCAISEYTAKQGVSGVRNLIATAYYEETAPTAGTVQNVIESNNGSSAAIYAGQAAGRMEFKVEHEPVPGHIAGADKFPPFNRKGEAGAGKEERGMTQEDCTKIAVRKGWVGVGHIGDTHPEKKLRDTCYRIPQKHAKAVTKIVEEKGNNLKHHTTIQIDYVLPTAKAIAKASVQAAHNAKGNAGDGVYAAAIAASDLTNGNSKFARSAGEEAILLEADADTDGLRKQLNRAMVFVAARKAARIERTKVGAKPMLVALAAGGAVAQMDGCTDVAPNDKAKLAVLAVYAGQQQQTNVQAATDAAASAASGSGDYKQALLLDFAKILTTKTPMDGVLVQRNPEWNDAYDNVKTEADLSKMNGSLCGKADNDGDVGPDDGDVVGADLRSVDLASTNSMALDVTAVALQTAIAAVA